MTRSSAPCTTAFLKSAARTTRSAARTENKNDSLTTGASKETLSKLLLRNPGIKNETAVIEMIHFLHDEGDRISFSILLPFLVAEYDPKELEEKIRERFFGIELFIRKCNNLHHFITCIKADQTIKIGEEELKRGILAWDMGRMVCLTRIAYDAGFIDESLAGHREPKQSMEKENTEIDKKLIYHDRPHNPSR